MKLLDVGTEVQVSGRNIGGRVKHSYRAIVKGYDMGRTKYHLAPEITPGLFSAEPYVWAFLSEVDAVKPTPNRREV